MKLVNKLIEIAERAEKHKQEIKCVVNIVEEAAYAGDWGVSINKREASVNEAITAYFESQGVDVEETASHIRLRWDKSLVK